MIDNCLKESVQECSVDLRLNNIFKLKSIKEVDKNKLPDMKELKLPYLIKPNEYLIGSTIEVMSNEKFAVLVFPKAYGIRIGLSIESGVLYPGFKAPVMFGIKNNSQNNIKLTKGVSLIQLCFLEIDSDFVKLAHKFQNGVFSKWQ